LGGDFFFNLCLVLFGIAWYEGSSLPEIPPRFARSDKKRPGHTWGGGGPYRHPPQQDTFAAFKRHVLPVYRAHVAAGTIALLAGPLPRAEAAVRTAHRTARHRAMLLASKKVAEEEQKREAAMRKAMEAAEADIQ
jgi:hypothetical protein